VRGSVAPRRLEPELHLFGGVELHPLVGQRRPGDIAAQLLQPLAVVRFHSHRSVQAEPVDVGASKATSGSPWRQWVRVVFNMGGLIADGVWQMLENRNIRITRPR